MAVTLKTSEEIEKMRIAGRLAGEVLQMIKPHVKVGVTTDELDIRTNAAKVDIEADKIKIRIIIVNDSGTTIFKSSGITASGSKTLASPIGNVNGAFPGFKKTRDVEPIKYAIHPINKAKNVDATIPIFIDLLSLIA